MANIAIRGMAVTYVRSTWEHVPTTIIGPSCHGDNCIYLRYMMRNGKEIEHNAAFDEVLFSIALCQRIGIPNLCFNLQQNLPQSQLRRASMSNCSR